MPRLLKLILPYAIGVLGTIAIFVAGAYSSAWFAGKVLAPRLGLEDVSQLSVDHVLLTSLDAGRVDEARSLLILEEDGKVMSLDMLAPYLPDDLAKSTCRIMQKIAQQRAGNAAKYSGTGHPDPEIRQSVATSLQNPAACAHK
jgi:hypothetical protein